MTGDAQSLIPMLLISMGGFFTLICYALVRALTRPQWSLKPHYKQLRARLNEPRQLAHEQAATPKPWPPATVSFDHVSNLGRVDYVVSVTLSERPFFPRHVALQEWRVPAKSIANEYEGQQFHAQVACSHRAHFMALRAFEVMEAMCKGMSNSRLLEYLDAHQHLVQREHGYESGTMTWSFYIRDSLFASQDDLDDAQRLDAIEELLAPLVRMLDGCVPAHDTDAQKWMAMSRIAIRFNDHQLYCVDQVLAHHTKTPEFDAFWTYHLAQRELPILRRLFEHDHKRFVRDLEPKHLQLFALDMLQHNPNMPPDIFAARFARRVPFGILEDPLVSMPLRAALVKAWFTHRDDDPELGQVELMIGSWSKKQQEQLRALLDTDSKMSGALTFSRGEAGQLSMSRED